MSFMGVGPSLVVFEIKVNSSACVSLIRCFLAIAAFSHRLNEAVRRKCRFILINGFIIKSSTNCSFMYTVTLGLT